MAVQLKTYYGLSFPFKFQKGNLSASEDVKKVKESVYNILLTIPGERVMRPLFGSDLYRLLFEDNDEMLKDMFKFEIQKAISQWEPRVSIDNIDVVVDETTVIATIEITVLGTENSILTLNFNRENGSVS